MDGREGSEGGGRTQWLGGQTGLGIPIGQMSAKPCSIPFPDFSIGVTFKWKK